MRRHSNWHQIHPHAKSFSDFIAERQVMHVADLNVTSMRGISHETSMKGARKTIGEPSQDELPVFSRLSLRCANRLKRNLAIPVSSN